jgi:hypothetical protein
VLHLRRELAGASLLCAEAETLFADLAENDPENADTRIFLVHAQYDYARVQRDLARFSEASSAYRRAIDNLGRIPVERLSAHSSNDFLRLEVLQRNLADCESAPLALGALASLQSKPTHDACRLLLTRVRLLKAMERTADTLDAVEAVCSLSADSAGDVTSLPSAIGQCAEILDNLRCTGPIEDRRTAIRRRCSDRAAALLARAIERGFADASRLETDPSLKWLHREPSFLSPVQRANHSLPAPSAATLSSAHDRH